MREYLARSLSYTHTHTHTLRCHLDCGCGEFTSSPCTSYAQFKWKYAWSRVSSPALCQCCDGGGILIFVSAAESPCMKTGTCFSKMFRLRLIMGLCLVHQTQEKTDAHPSAHANSGVITLLTGYPGRYFWIQLYFVLQTSVWGDKVPLYRDVLSVLVTALFYSRAKLWEGEVDGILRGSQLMMSKHWYFPEHIACDTSDLLHLLKYKQLYSRSGEDILNRELI